MLCGLLARRLLCNGIAFGRLLLERFLACSFELLLPRRLELCLSCPLQACGFLLCDLLARGLLRKGIAASRLLFDGVLARRFQLLVPRRLDRKSVV